MAGFDPQKEVWGSNLSLRKWEQAELGGGGQGRPETCPVDRMAPSGELTAGSAAVGDRQDGVPLSAAVCTVKAQHPGGGSRPHSHTVAQETVAQLHKLRSPEGAVPQASHVLPAPHHSRHPAAPGTRPLPAPGCSQHLRADQVLTQHPASKYRLVARFRCLVGERVQVSAG